MFSATRAAWSSSRAARKAGSCRARYVSAMPAALVSDVGGQGRTANNGAPASEPTTAPATDSAAATEAATPAADAGKPAAEAAKPAETRPAESRAADAPKPPPAKPETLKITDLKDLSIQKLTQIAKDKNVAGATGMRKQDLIFQILKAQT